MNPPNFVFVLWLVGGVVVYMVLFCIITGLRAWRKERAEKRKPAKPVKEIDERPWLCRGCGALDHRHKAKWCPRCGRMRPSWVQSEPVPRSGDTLVFSGSTAKADWRLITDLEAMNWPTKVK